MSPRSPRTLERPSFADAGASRYALARLSWLAGERGRHPVGQAAPYRLPAARVAQIDDYVDGLAWRLRGLGTA
jgi:hypothetical protein